MEKTISEPERHPEKNANPARREILVTGVFFTLLFAVMIYYTTRFVSVEEEEMVNNSYNPRQEALLSQNYRGAIYADDGVILAETVLLEGQKEARVYPFRKLFAHIVGYSTNGRMGVEASANYHLVNTHTSLTDRVANDMAGLKNPGDNVYTSLNVELQLAADSQLGDYRGAAVVTEVSTGRILAMVSHPNFDPNEIDEIWDSLLEDSSSSVLLNRATQGLYPPGSIFKIVTALEFIRENPDTYEKYAFQCPGYLQSGGARVNCFRGTRHGRVDLRNSLVQSCNSSFANIGMGLDWSSFAGTLEELMFNGKLPLDLNYSKSSVNVDAASMDAEERMQTSFGQGKTLVTPVHMNMITAAVANGGVLMKPYAVDRVVNDAGEPVKAFQPEACGRLMTEEEAALLSGLMASVIRDGSDSGKFRGAGYTVAGKTGSAEYNDIKGECHAWFTGFAPAENPEICVTIILEGAGNAGDYATPAARKIFDAWFGQKQAVEYN